MRKLFVLVIFFISLFLFVASVQAEISLKAEVDKTKITTDDTITYKLTITSSAKEIPLPKFPKFEGFVALSNVQTSQISISSGTQKTLVVYVFILAPVKTGKLKIEPSEIEIEGKSYSSDAFEIEVKQGKVKPRHKAEEEPSTPKSTQPESEQPQISL